jgi:intein-encoded DNA endonuclease-like protein|tara:strand:- start:255 stop:389 length:135 start_codon:yes stop_codon:yes gene_type:complete
MLDNKETFVEPKVSELILNMIEHIDELNSKLDIYENNFLGKADA